ncbi:hypothetical protein [Undibacterium oligocarboniphilum]|uniref:Uncharacterized protein n=1 Tax=Undibacterium oligocarboniphilum TaxID=666702 RepID=A0A850QKA4_9BURK|nr:hypothetical protein [Undibacterium oligocarboniphilum]MBC3869434.1 hypothetical protein [Undibacterium oligocarboniphilum]NVO77813.1 hypothetical protein [Undibacterium oligocarboniphilum]
MLRRSKMYARSAGIKRHQDFEASLPCNRTVVWCARSAGKTGKPDGYLSDAV